MKNFSLILSLLFLSVLSFGQMQKVALVSFWANKEIDASEFGTLGFVRTLAQDPAFDLQGIVENFKDKIYSDLAKEFPFELLPEDKLINNQEYKNLGQLNQSAIGQNWYTTPEGYYYLPTTKQVKEGLFDAFKDEGVDGLMYVWVEYKLNKEAELMGFGTAKVTATVTVEIFDKTGKKVMWLPVYQNSSSRMKFALGGNALEAKKILPLCEETTDKCFVRMKAKLPKKLDKMNKKLAKHQQ